MHKKIELSLERFHSHHIFPLLIIMVIGLTLRLVFTNWALPPPSPDNFVFFIEAKAFSQGNFEYFSLRSLWPLFVSVFFLFVRFEDTFSYLSLMRVISILISVASIPIVYFIARKFVENKWAMLATAFYAFGPDLIQNSTFGITEPLFLILSLISILFLLQEKKYSIYLAFLFSALALDTHLKGITLVLLIVIVCCFKVKPKLNLVKTLLIGLTIFAMVSFMYITIPLEQGNIPFVHYITGISNLVSNNYVSTGTYDEVNQLSSYDIIKNVLTKEVLHFGRIMIPYLVVFVPLGAIIIIKKRVHNSNILFLTIILSLIVAIPHYVLSAELRNLFLIVPILCIFAAIGIKRILFSSNIQNILIIVIIVGVIIGSVGFLHYVIKDDSLLRIEKEDASKYIVENFNGRIMGDLYNELSHNLPNAKVGEREKEGNIYNDKLSIVVSEEPIDSMSKLNKYVDLFHINYLIIDSQYDQRYPIFQEIFYDENKFENITKIYDSNDKYKQLHVKIFKLG